VGGGGVRPPGPLCARPATGHPVRPPLGPGLTGLSGPSRLLPILGVNTCPLFFNKACVLKNNSKDDKAVVGHFYAKGDFHRNRT
jgi:hypothetical protein